MTTPTWSGMGQPVKIEGVRMIRLPTDVHCNVTTLRVRKNK